MWQQRTAATTPAEDDWCRAPSAHRRSDVVSIKAQVERASLEDDDLASDYAAAAQGFQVLVDVFELDFGDVVLDAAGFGEGEHFDEVQVIAPEGAEVGQFRADEGELAVLDALAHETDCCQGAFGAQQVEAHGDR